MPRTMWAEVAATDIASRPLVREGVFSNVRYIDRTEREVCDLMLVLRGQAIVCQIKAQEDPLSRSGPRLVRWVIKKAKDAQSQLHGAIRTIKQHKVWCQHPRRGQVDFSRGELTPVQGVVLVENLGERVELPEEYPLACEGVPLHYFSVNDFLNIVDQLRAFPEVIDYLNLRRGLPSDTRRAVGGEQVLYKHYLLNQGSFEGWTSYGHMWARLQTLEPEVSAAITRKLLADEDARLIEYVADALAARSEKYLEGLPKDFTRMFDRPDQRRNYLIMQEELSDLRLSERRLLGSQFRTVIRGCERSSRKQEMTYAAAHFDSKPDFVYILASSKSIPREALLSRGLSLSRAGATFYGKTRGMLIVDGDGRSFEVFLLSRHEPSEEDISLGKSFFGSLRHYDFLGNLVPDQDARE